MSEADLRKQLAARLAETIKDSTTLPLLQFLCNGALHVDWRLPAHGIGPFASLAEDVLGLMTSQATGRPAVGIWEQEPDTGDFVRSRTHLDLWRFCADVERIPRKGNRKRVVFLGESVGRGFFFDPFYCPARVLEEQLSSTGVCVEVVDLAQSNSDPWWLSVVAAATPLLEPDAIVVFAGNNWRAGPLANVSAEHFAVDGPLLAADRGFSELLTRQRQRLDTIATQTVMHLSIAAAKARAALVLVIPEVNVGDWSNCPVDTLDVPLMSDDDTRNWVTAYVRASEAMQASAFAKAERLVREAVDRDGGASSASLDLLARAQLHQGNVRDASATLRQSRDLTLGFLDGTRVVPGIFSSVAETIRRVGAQAGATVVDLPQVFGDYYRGEMPGRRQFLDYCHLTSEGIRVAMAATAKSLAPLLGIETIELADLVTSAPSPSAEQEGWAHLLAGIHNAHWGQGIETCSHHFRRAIECYPPLEESAIPCVYDAFRHAAPSILLSSFDELARNKIAAVYLIGYGLHYRRFGLVREYGLLASLVAALPSLENTCPDPDLSLGHVSEIDLLRPHWSALTDGNRWYQRGFTAAYEFESIFPFVCAESQTLSLALTCRVPGAREAGEVVVELNGTAIGRILTHGDWHSGHCTADARIVKQGLNSLTLRWPNVSRFDMRNQLRHDFETGRKLDTRTHFGHFHELRISLSSMGGGT